MLVVLSHLEFMRLNHRYIIRTSLDYRFPLAKLAKLPAKQKASFKAWDDERGPWDVIYHHSIESIPNDRSESVVHVVQPVTRIARDVYLPPPQLPQSPPLDKEDWEEEVSAYFEWAGLASLGSQRYVLFALWKFSMMSCLGVCSDCRSMINQTHISLSMSLLMARKRVIWFIYDGKGSSRAGPCIPSSRQSQRSTLSVLSNRRLKSQSILITFLTLIATRCLSSLSRAMRCCNLPSRMLGLTLGSSGYQVESRRIVGV